MPGLRGLATGIGSLPYKDVQEALDLIFKYTPQAPFWPQLPRRDKREGMVEQFSENIPCIRVSADGVFFDSRDKERELEVFYERLIANDVAYFKISENFAAGIKGFCRRLQAADLQGVEFIKCHITGPFTFASAMVDEKGAMLLHDSVFKQAILKALTMKALWQIETFRRFKKRIILFIDEPYLGCFGSAYTPINREEAVRDLSELTSSLKSQDVLIGLHCCGNTDWSILTDIDTIDIINFDAFGFLDRLALYADNLKGFFKRGGVLAWGIVPTQEKPMKETRGSLLKKIHSGMDLLCRKGLDKELLSENLIFTPSCGLGTLSTEESGSIFRLLSEVSAGYKGQF